MNLYILLKQNPTMELELGFPVRDRANGGLIFRLPSSLHGRW